METSRRNFIKKATTSGAALIAAPAVFGSAISVRKSKAADATEPFKLKYAPGLTMFRQNAGSDPVDNIKFCYDQGFRAIFDNGLMGREPEVQDKIAAEMKRLGMTFGPFVLMGLGREPNFVLNTPEMRETLSNKMKECIETVKRTGANLALIAPGLFDMRLHMDFQTANVIDNLRMCCDILEPEGITIVLEPLNTLRNHPGSFLTGIPQSYAICRAVNRKSCKIVNDIYHQQISEGNLIPNLEAAWSEIGAFHLGDNPGRNEPTTGEINFKSIFKTIYSKKYEGTLCMEHGISQRGTKEGELRVIQAYRECDSFEV